MGQGVATSVGAIGEEMRRASLGKNQRPWGPGSNLNPDGDLGTSAGSTRQPRGFLSMMHSPQHGTSWRPSAWSTVDSPWSGGLFGLSSFPRPTAVRRSNHFAPMNRPFRPPAATSTSDRDPCASLGRHYLTIRKSPQVYLTEDWREMNMSLYCPLAHDVMINTETVDQISYDSSCFFIGYSTGDFAGTRHGDAVHIWHHDRSKKKLYVTMSILFLKKQDYEYVMELLKRL